MIDIHFIKVNLENSFLLRFILTVGILLTIKPTFSQQQICLNDHKKTALIIMDMQKGFHERLDGSHNSEVNIEKYQRLITEQLRIIELAKSRNITIIIIEFFELFEGQNFFGETNQALLDAVHDYQNKVIIYKDFSDILGQDNLNRLEFMNFLADQKIGQFILIGANGPNCIQMSLSSLLKNNCSVVTVDTGIANFHPVEIGYPYANDYRSAVDSFTKIPVVCKNCKYKKTNNYHDLKNFLENGW